MTMQLSEFITFCTLKGRVLEHKKMTAPRAHVHEYFKIKIQARGYGVTIFYAKLDDVITSGQYSLIDYQPPVSIKKNATLEEIVQAILPQ